MVVGNNSSIHDHLLEQEHRLFNPHLYPVGDVEYLVYGILMPTFGTISIVANFIIFITLLNKNRTKGSSSLSLLLNCLAGYDTWVSFLSIWLYSLPTLCQVYNVFGNYLNTIHPHCIRILYPVLHMAITGSDYLNLAAAIERYLALDRNFRARKSPNQGCPTNKTWFYILIILVGTIIYNIPMIMEKYVETIYLEDGSVQVQVLPTSLRSHKIYIQLYRLTTEFLVFKATPWMSFFILFLSLKDRLKYYLGKKVRKSLGVEQYLELMDSRIILGINSLFYVTNALPLYIGFCHIVLFDVSDEIVYIGNLMIVLNSTFKFFIYCSLSHDFRLNLKRLFKDDIYHWILDEEKNFSFLHHVKVASFVQKGSDDERKSNLCYTDE